MPDKEIPSGFDAMGKPIPPGRQDKAYETAKDFGLVSYAAWEAVSGMTESLQRDRPAEAIHHALKYVDLIGAYRLMAMLLSSDGSEGVPSHDPADQVNNTKASRKKMTINEMRVILNNCKFSDYRWGLIEDIPSGIIHLQARFSAEDVVTKKTEFQFTRKWLIDPDITEDDLVSTVFKCVLAAVEHETRETFTYRDFPIYQPHHSVTDLITVCKKERVK
jgi:hypothetical protein